MAKKMSTRKVFLSHHCELIWELVLLASSQQRPGWLVAFLDEVLAAFLKFAGGTKYKWT
jgi:hypothetical protein